MNKHEETLILLKSVEVNEEHKELIEIAIIAVERDAGMIKCRDCKYYYKEHCYNNASNKCTDPVDEDYYCEAWESGN